MIIRPASHADASDIALIREETIRTVVAPLGQYTAAEVDAWTSGYGVDRVIGFIDRGNFWVVEEDGRVVGYGRIDVASACATIRGVFVRAQRVGHGIGGSILKHLMQEARRLGATRFELVATLNARSFYERHGFKVVEHVRHQTPGGAIIPGIRMEREAIDALGGNVPGHMID